MDGKLKIALQVLFLVALIWLLGALAGKLPGASLRIGVRKKGKGRCGQRRIRGNNPNTWVASGMGAELIQSAGTDKPPAGYPQIAY